MNPRIMLCILDGWGIPLQSEEESSAIRQDTAPFYHQMCETYGCAQLQASGQAVGLPEGTQGNSEVGHLTIGSGFVQPSAHFAISEALLNKSLEISSQWKAFVQHLHSRNSTLHIATLLTSGLIHADILHLQTIAALLHKENITINLHGFLDGRDSPPGSANLHLATLQKTVPFINVVTLSGRSHAMDRSGDWSRTLATYNTIIHGHNPRFTSLDSALPEDFTSDEHLPPCAQTTYKGFDYTQDTFLFLNFRSDRMVQIVSALCDPTYKHPQPPEPQKQAWMSMVPYQSLSTIDYFINPQKPQKTLSYYLTQHDLNQVRIAEHEKSFHVTYFFDGQSNVTHPSIQNLCTTALDPSEPYDYNVTTNQVTQATIESIENESNDFILVNFGACDILGHSGNLLKAENAVHCVDRALSLIVPKAEEHGLITLITADHGNAEVMTRNNKPYTSHTCNPVPFIIASTDYALTRSQGALQDIAPTVMSLFSLTQPQTMHGKSLCTKKAE